MEKSRINFCDPFTEDVNPVSNERLTLAATIERNIREAVQEQYKTLPASSQAAITNRVTLIYCSIGEAVVAQSTYNTTHALLEKLAPFKQD